MKEIIKLGLVLLLVCAIAATALAFTNEVTKDKIIQNAIEANRLARQEVFPNADDFKLIASEDEEAEFEAHANSASFLSENPEVKEVYEALSGDQVVGYVIKAEPNGYGGAVEVIVGFDIEGTLTGVRVGNHQETPGLGAKAKTEKFYLQYDGLTVASSIEVVKVDVAEGSNQIKAISGATITSAAVTQGVNYGQAVLETFK